MEYKKLGKSDVLVSELILGCWAMGGDYFGATEDKSSLEALEVSYENGVNTFDTAEIMAMAVPSEWWARLPAGLAGTRCESSPRCSSPLCPTIR